MTVPTPVAVGDGVEITKAYDAGCEAGPVPRIGVTVGRRLLPQPAMAIAMPVKVVATAQIVSDRLALYGAGMARAGKNCRRNLLIQSLSCLLVDCKSQVWWIGRSRRGLVGSLGAGSASPSAGEVFSPVIRKPDKALKWQSKAILLIVVPWTVVSVLLQSHWWLQQVPVVAWTTLGISGIFGLVVWRLRAGTLAAAATGAAITASLMFSTTSYPYTNSWLHGGLMPLLAVFLLTFVATKIGKAKKEQLGTGESKRGRDAAQVAANLGAAALVSSLASLLELGNSNFYVNIGAILAIAVLAEAAADTVSSEIGQVFGGSPRMLTTLQRVEAGTDGGVTLAGTLAGVAAATVVAAIGSWGIGAGWLVGVFCTAGAVFGLLFDSLLGATLERKKWLNNDAVNFLSTLSAPAFTFAIALSWSFLFTRPAR
jgi:uncharacterized protein (TIGR00297 family)